MELVDSVCLGLLGGLTGFALAARRMTASSPLAGVALVSWQRFVGLMAVAPKNAVSPRGRLGTFQMDARRLKDVGLMESAKKTGSAGEWVGQWKGGLTREQFLGSMPLQYAAFCRSMRTMAPKVSGLVGQVVDGKTCSLSGLLGVGHMAGEVGLLGWLADADARKRFGATTAVFDNANQIF